jgi:hypothetical protein
MDKFIKSITAISSVIVLFGFLACNKLNTDDVVPGAGLLTAPAKGGKITAKVDGLAFVSNIDSTDLAFGYFRILGISQTGGTIILNISNPAVGTFSLSPNSVDGIGSFQITGINYETTNPGTSGTITISKIDTVKKIISGTFTMKVADQNANFRNITEGVFTELSYKKLKPTVIYTANTYGCKVDGNPFSVGSITASATSTVITINDISPTSETMQLLIPTSVTSSSTIQFLTYGPPNYVKGVYQNVAGTQYVSASGNMVITLHDPANRHIEGLFRYDGEVPPSMPVAITDGTFYINY